MEPAPYLLSNEAYAHNPAQARTQGWPVAAIPNANDLSTITAPLAVTDHLLDLARELHPIKLIDPAHHRPAQTVSRASRFCFGPSPAESCSTMSSPSSFPWTWKFVGPAVRPDWLRLLHRRDC